MFLFLYLKYFPCFIDYINIFLNLLCSFVMFMVAFVFWYIDIFFYDFIFSAWLFIKNEIFNHSKVLKWHWNPVNLINLGKVNTLVILDFSVWDITSTFLFIIFINFYFIFDYSCLTVLCFRFIAKWFSYTHTCIYSFSVFFPFKLLLNIE